MGHGIVPIAAVLAIAASACAPSQRCSHVNQPTTLDGPQPVAVRVQAGSIWVGTHAASQARRAWSVPGRGHVDRLAVQQLAGEGGFVVTFEQDGVAWRGVLDARRMPLGPISPFAAAPRLDATTATAWR